MKKLFFMLGTVAAFSFLVSCEGPEGPAGPTGPTGPTGNEEVHLFTYGPRDFNALNSYINVFSFDALTKDVLDNSLMVAYSYTASWGDWNTVNGPGPIGVYQSVQYYHEADSSIHIYLLNGDGSGYTGSDVTWDSTKIYVIPPSMIRAAEKQGLDFSDIHEVERFTNVK